MVVHEKRSLAILKRLTQRPPSGFYFYENAVEDEKGDKKCLESL